MRSRGYAAALGIATAAALLVGCSQGDPGGADSTDPVDTSDWEPEWVDGVLQPLPDGFPEEPIVMVSRGDPGSRNGILMRQLFNVVERMAPEGVRLEDAPLTGLGSWEELDQLNQVDSEGYRVMIVALAGSSVDSLTDSLVASVVVTAGVGSSTATSAESSSPPEQAATSRNASRTACGR